MNFDFTRDSTWGYVLIFLGVILLAFKPGDKFNSWLNNQGNTAITFGLFMTIAVYLAIAIFAKPAVKAVALAWAVTP